MTVSAYNYKKSYKLLSMQFWAKALKNSSRTEAQGLYL